MIDQAISSWVVQVLGADPKEILPITGGGNNRVYRITTADDRPLLLKQYYYSAADPRDRLRTEFDFLSYAQDCGLRCVPAPIAESPELHCALYKFLEGRKPAPVEINRHAILQALHFLEALNVRKSSDAARSLRPASESCFSLREHIARVDGRMERLRMALLHTAEPDQSAQHFLTARLTPAWNALRDRLLHPTGTLAPETPIYPDERFISPSDFGFHNTLITPDGTFLFLDFEYAGWDDPAKLVGDFFSQVALPVSPEHIPLVIQNVSAQTPQPETTARRIRALLPLYRIKWCCIVLNEFIPDERRRRSYACGEIAESRQHAQMEKACRLLDSLKDLEEASS